MPPEESAPPASAAPAVATPPVASAPPAAAPPAVGTDGSTSAPVAADPAKPAGTVVVDPTKVDASGKPAGDGNTDATKVTGAPEAYEAFKLPEGVALDSAITTKFQGIAKELNLDQAGAQKLADIGAEMAQKFAVDQQAAIKAARSEWVQSLKDDKDFGGEKFDANLGIAKKALDAFGSPELSKLLKDSGLGDNPAVVKAFYKIGKAISEDKIVVQNGGGAPLNNTTAANKMYPNQTGASA